MVVENMSLNHSPAPTPGSCSLLSAAALLNPYKTNNNNKKISKEKKQLLYKAMEAFRLLMDVHGVDDYMACATSAMREAKNGKKIAQKIADELDIEIDIITGKRESELRTFCVMFVFNSQS